MFSLISLILVNCLAQMWLIWANSSNDYGLFYLLEMVLLLTQCIDFKDTLLSLTFKGEALNSLSFIKMLGSIWFLLII